jgi:hypothetical protein
VATGPSLEPGARTHSGGHYMRPRRRGSPASFPFRTRPPGPGFVLHTSGPPSTHGSPVRTRRNGTDCGPARPQCHAARAQSRRAGARRAAPGPRSQVRVIKTRATSERAGPNSRRRPLSACIERNSDRRRDLRGCGDVPEVMRRLTRSTAVLVFALALVVTRQAPGGWPAREPTTVIAQRSAAETFRLVGAPVVVVHPTSDGPFFQARARLNRGLPEDRQGVRANFLVGRSGSDADPVAFGRRPRHCYASTVGNDAAPDPDLASVRPGSKVRLTIRIAARQQIARTVTARSRSYIRLRTLGCGVRH